MEGPAGTASTGIPEATVAPAPSRPEAAGPAPGRPRGPWATLFLVASVVLLGVLAYLAWRERDPLMAALRTLPARTLLVTVLLTLGAYVLRLLKWLWLLRRLETRPPALDASVLFFAGLLLALTPGKLGEFWKAWALGAHDGHPPAKLLPAILMERITDFCAIVGLALAAAGLLGLPGLALWLVGAGFFLGIALITRPAVWQWLGARLDRREKLRAISAHVGDGLTLLGRPRTMVVSILLSIGAWGLEALTVKVVLDGLGYPVSWTFGVWVFAAGTLAGVLSILPGGLGGAEAVMAGILLHDGASTGVAAATTLVVRACTLGLGAGIGALALPWWLALARRKRAAVALSSPSR